MNVSKLQAVLLCLLVCATLGWAQTKAMPTPTPVADSKERAAQLAAENWLALVDAGKYADSWEQAAPLFKEAVTKSDWIEAVSKTKLPLGKLKTRKVKHTQATDKVQGAPAGQYVLLQTEAVFENKAAAKELVTLTFGKDGQWRIVGYFIQ